MTAILAKLGVEGVPSTLATAIRTVVGTVSAWAGRFLIVEYDSDEATQWVPYPVGRTALTALFARANGASVAFLRSRRSVYRRAPLYSALITYTS